MNVITPTEGLFAKGACVPSTMVADVRDDDMRIGQEPVVPFAGYKMSGYGTKGKSRR